MAVAVVAAPARCGAAPAAPRRRPRQIDCSLQTDRIGIGFRGAAGRGGAIAGGAAAASSCQQPLINWALLTLVPFFPRPMRGRLNGTTSRHRLCAPAPPRPPFPPGQPPSAWVARHWHAVWYPHLGHLGPRTARALPAPPLRHFPICLDALGAALPARVVAATPQRDRIAVMIAARGKIFTTRGGDTNRGRVSSARAARAALWPRAGRAGRAGGSGDTFLSVLSPPRHLGCSDRLKLSS